LILFDPKAMVEEAEKKARSVDFWYRQHYRLPLHDPRFEATSIQEMLLEHEAYLCFLGEEKKHCPKCERDTFRKECPYCGEEGVSLTGDEDMDEMTRKIMKGEKVDFSEFFNDKFEEVKPGGK
jgi:hypothetical protein